MDKDKKIDNSAENGNKTDAKEAEKIIVSSKQELDALKKNIDGAKDDKEKFEKMVDYVAEKIVKLMSYKAMQIKEIVWEWNSAMFEVLEFFGVNPIESIVSQLLDDGMTGKLGFAFLKKKYTSAESVALIDEIEAVKNQLPGLTNLDACVNFAQSYGIPLPEGIVSQKTTTEISQSGKVENQPKSWFDSLTDELKTEKIAKAVADYAQLKEKTKDLSDVAGSGMLVDLEKSLGFLQKNFTLTNELALRDLTSSVATSEITVWDWITIETDGKKSVYLVAEKPKDGKIKVAGSETSVEASKIVYAGKVDYQKLKEKTS